MQQAIYLRQLDIVLQGEVFGEYAYAIAARHSPFIKPVKIWATLRVRSCGTVGEPAQRTAHRRNFGAFGSRFFAVYL
jgi:hypothetical protein